MSHHKSASIFLSPSTGKKNWSRAFTPTLTLASRPSLRGETVSTHFVGTRDEQCLKQSAGAHAIMPKLVYGFTLIEVLITIALFAILMLGIVQLYVVYGRTIELQQSSVGVALGGSSILDAVRAAGLQASNVIAAHTFSGISYNSGTTTALFELPAIDSSGAILANTYDYIGIYASSTSAYRIVDAAPGSSRVSEEKQLTSVLGALTFTYDNPSFPSVARITVDATTSAVVRGKTVQTHLRGLIYLRNL